MGVLPWPSDSISGKPLEAPIDLSKGDWRLSQSSFGSIAAVDVAVCIRTRLSVLLGTVELGAVLSVLLFQECWRLSIDVLSTDEREVVLVVLV